ncbi:MAG: hypothetical protein A2X45_17435 [Lentisphaerae bacterium GWF2_50_93]|nr:MAG: hypothetical protein A2X45_17435 [Lentisphaerae bacterium GWF2_50_93]
MYVSLPAFEKILVGTGVDLAARNTTSRLGMARNYAISTRKCIALLMPTSGLPDQYCYGANRMCIVNSNGTYDSGTLVTTYTFQRWVQSENWEFTNPGSVIIDVDNIAGCSGTALVHEQVDGVKCSDIEAGYATVNNVRAIIFKPSGKIACDTLSYSDRFVTVGEGAYSAGALIWKNRSNVIDVKIEKYTGRVSYGNK